MVWRPGTWPWPRIFTTCSLRTIELRLVACDSQMIPSAMVKTGLDSASVASYSPIRNVVASQLVR